MNEPHAVVSREEWLETRRQLLAREKAFTRERDQLSAERRALPWERVDKNYVFDTPQGKQTLAELFGTCSQLVVYHFMFGPDWQEPCKSCSFWADNFNGIPVHLRHRDVTLIAVTSAPLTKIEALKQRLGWTFTMVSSGGSSFNHDYNVSFSRDELEAGEVTYNYRPMKTSMTELPGISVFYRDPAGNRVPHLLLLCARPRYAEWGLPLSRSRPKRPRRGRTASAHAMGAPARQLWRVTWRTATARTNSPRIASRSPSCAGRCARCRRRSSRNRWQTTCSPHHPDRAACRPCSATSPTCS